jgi:hypothetical protein
MEAQRDPGGKSRAFVTASGAQSSSHPLFGTRQGGRPAKGFFCGGLPFFCAAEKTEKSGICSKIDHRLELDT